MFFAANQYVSLLQFANKYLELTFMGIAEGFVTTSYNTKMAYLHDSVVQHSRAVCRCHLYSECQCGSSQPELVCIIQI